MKKFEQFPENFFEYGSKMIIDVMATAIILESGRMPVTKKLCDCAEKLLEKGSETETPVKGTRRPGTRGERRKATVKAKENALYKAKNSKNGGYEPIYRGEHGETKIKSMPISEWLQEGEKAFWKHVPAAKRTGKPSAVRLEKGNGEKNSSRRKEHLLQLRSG